MMRCGTHFRRPAGHSPAGSPIHRRDATTAESGITLIEVTITVALLGIVIAGAMSFWVRSQDAFNEQVRRSVVNEIGQRALARLAEEVVLADSASLLPIVITNSEFIQFSKVIGLENGLPVYSPTVTLQRQPEAGETLGNGIDDNLDGRIDEGYIVYSEAGTTPIQLVGDILDLRFTGLTNGISVTVTAGKVADDGTVETQDFTRVIAFRNQ